MGSLHLNTSVAPGSELRGHVWVGASKGKK